MLKIIAIVIVVAIVAVLGTSPS
jgi:hypothetical protein